MAGDDQDIKIGSTIRLPFEMASGHGDRLPQKLVWGVIALACLALCKVLLHASATECR